MIKREREAMKKRDRKVHLLVLSELEALEKRIL